MKAWFNFLALQEKKMGKEAVQRWLGSLKILSYDACNLYLEAENSFQIAFFKEHIQPFLKNSFLNNNFRPIKVHLSLKGGAADLEKNKKRTFQKKPFPSKPPLAFLPHTPSSSSTFQNFFITSANELSFKLFLDLSGAKLEKDKDQSKDINNHKHTKSSPPKIFSPPFNPVYLYGPASSGKTHLLESLANVLEQAKLNFFYINAKTFTEHVVSAMRFGSINEFRAKYRAIDALLIDDIHILARKNATQEEFFHTFNALHMSGKLVVLTSLYSPLQLKEIEERLISRFQWGITLTLEKVGQTGLLSILSQKAEEYSLKLTNETMDFLLSSFPTVKDLQKALQALTMRHADKEKEIEQVSAEHLLQDLLSEQARKAITPDFVIDKIAQHFGLRKEDLLSKGQSKELSFPRQIAIYFLRQKLALTYQKIGSIFKRDHSTIMSSFKNIQKINTNQNKEKEGQNLAILRKINTSLEIR